MRQGDFSNAILVLNRAQQLDPRNFAVAQDMAQSYYYGNDLQKAAGIIKTLVDREEANDQTFQIAGNVYVALGDNKEAEKIYKKGLKRFESSGPLYNDYGQLMYRQKNDEAIKLFEKGIETDPGYAKNYLNATYYYNSKGNIAWPLIYGELYVNMDPYGKETPAIKQLLLDTYKKFFTTIDFQPFVDREPSAFGKLFLQTLGKQSSIVANGISPESLTMIRTRFSLDWYNAGPADKYPFRLFEHHQQLLRDGLFNAYNQWLFGTVQNLTAYQEWVNAHNSEYRTLYAMQKNKVFKLPAGQFYNR